MSLTAYYYNQPTEFEDTFRPNQVPNLTAWWKADSEVFQEATFDTASGNGDPVGGWKDQSGNGNHLFQATATNKPTLQTGVQNGKPTIRSDGTNDILETGGAINLSSGYTVFLAMESSSASDMVIEQSASASSNAGFYYFTSGAVNNRRRNTSPANIDLDDSGDTIIDGSWHVVEMHAGSAGGALISDGTTLDSDATNSGTLGNDNIYLFARSGPTLSLNGDIAEVIIYSRALSAAERSSVRKYLGNKYAITVT